MTTAITSLKTQVVNRRLGLWIFMISESMIFLALFAARFYMQGTHRPEEVNQLLGMGITVILLLSSFTANRAEISIAHGDRSSFLRLLGTTIVLGLVFLCVVVFIEWPEAMKFAPPSTGYGTAFFALTGMHAFHVLTGLLILLISWFQGRAGRYTADDHWGAEAGIVYWHFVDVIWVFVYPILYLFGG